MNQQPGFAATCPEGHTFRQVYTEQQRAEMAAGGPVYVWCLEWDRGWEPSPELQRQARAWARAERTGD